MFSCLLCANVPTHLCLSRVLRAYVTTCLLAFAFYVTYAPFYSVCISAYLLLCYTCLRAYVLFSFTYLNIYVPLPFRCLSAYMSLFFAFLRAFVFYVPTCLRPSFYVPMCLRAFVFYVPSCLSVFICLRVPLRDKKPTPN